MLRFSDCGKKGELGLNLSECRVNLVVQDFSFGS